METGQGLSATSHRDRILPNCKISRHSLRLYAGGQPISANNDSTVYVPAIKPEVGSLLLSRQCC